VHVIPSTRYSLRATRKQVCLLFIDLLYLIICLLFQQQQNNQRLTTVVTKAMNNTGDRSIDHPIVYDIDDDDVCEIIEDGEIS
jgi:hypothetical protein